MSTPLWTNYLTQFVVAVVATISFGITFHVPKRHYLAGGLRSHRNIRFRIWRTDHPEQDTGSPSPI